MKPNISNNFFARYNLNFAKITFLNYVQIVCQALYSHLFLSKIQIAHIEQTNTPFQNDIDDISQRKVGSQKKSKV